MAIVVGTVFESQIFTYSGQAGLVDGVLLGLGWHRPEQGATRRAMPMLAFFCGLALLMHGVGAWAIPGLLM